MGRSKILLAVVGIVALVLAALPAVGCAPKPAVKPEKTFTVYFFADISRIFTFVNVPRLLGIRDSMDYINTELGGVQGRKYRLIWADHLNDLSVGATIYDRWRTEANFIFLGVCGSQENEAFHFRYEEDEVVVSTCGVADRALYPAGYVFGTTPTYPNQFAGFIDWLVETWDWKGMGRGPNLAFMTYDSPYGRGCLTKECYAYAEKKGVKVVDTMFVPVVVVDAATPLTRVKAAGADWIYGHKFYNTLITLGKENLKGKYGLKFAECVWAADDALAKLGGEATEGMVLMTPYVLWSEKDKPAIKLIDRVTKAKGRRPEDLTATYLLGWMNMFTIQDALDALVPKLGWEGINGRVLMRHLTTWKEYDLHGLVRVTYKDFMREPGMQRVAVVRKGELVPLTAYRPVPWNIAPELTKAYVEPATPAKPKKVF